MLFRSVLADVLNNVVGDQIPHGSTASHSFTAVSEILETGANDVYVLRAGDGSEKLIAAIPENVLRVDLSARTIWVRVPEAYSAE